jgi:PhnB protein
MVQVNVYLNFAGNTEEAFTFYRDVFGGEFASVVRFKDMPMEGTAIPAEDASKIMHIGLPIGDGQMLMATDTLASLGQQLVQGNNVHISVHPSLPDPVLDLPGVVQPSARQRTWRSIAAYRSHSDARY